MIPDELLGASIEIAAAGYELADPALDVALADGGGHLVATRERAILRVAGVGTFAVADGSRIRYEPERDVPAGAVSVWLHGTVAALVLAQRGRFALHASVVDVEGAGIAITGPRGAGKSTTALRLMQRGHPLVTDDVSPLEPGDPLTVEPFARSIRLSPQAAAGLELDVSEARPVMPGHPKLELPPPSRTPVPVAAIVELGTAGVGAGVGANRVRGAQAHWLVSTNVYRAALLRELCHEEMFAWAGAVAASVRVHVVTRPPESWTVDAVVSSIERIAAECPRLQGAAVTRTRSAP
jgi:hypothetical protein